MKYRYLNINEVNMEDAMKNVSVARLEKASKIKSDVDKKRSVCVELLLNEMIRECRSNHDESEDTNDIGIPVKLTYDEKGKPHIYDNDGNDAIYFSLSHSGDYVACIVSDRLCGIDIEKHSDRREYEKIAARICTENELKMISNREEFYDIWTLKESMLKATGQGLSLDMSKVEFIKEGNEFISKVNEKKYRGVVLPAPCGYSFSYVEEAD